VGQDTLLIAEAGVIAADVTQLSKLLVGRERPSVHALAPDEKLRAPRHADNNLSFFSGHTSEAFALSPPARWRDPRVPLGGPRVDRGRRRGRDDGVPAYRRR